MTRNGVRLAILNAAEGEFCYPTETTLGSSCLNEGEIILTLKDLIGKVDASVVVIHAGREYAFFPATWLVHMCRRFVRAGASAVIAHHPHVPQGVEVFEGGLICYSLGNFVFDYPGHADVPGTAIGMMVQCGFSKRGLITASLVPTIKRGYVVSGMGRRQKKAFLRFLAAISAPLADDARAAAVWNEYVRRDADAYLHAVKDGAAAYPYTNAGESRYAALILFAYLTGCRTHREIAGSAIRQVFERRKTSDPVAAKAIKTWERALRELLELPAA